jgi:hypothetical protein
LREAKLCDLYRFIIIMQNFTDSVLCFVS